MRIAIHLAFLLLQRRCEILGMSKSELDLKHGVWVIPASRMKSKRPHAVPLSRWAIQLIETALSLVGDRETDLVCRATKQPMISKAVALALLGLGAGPLAAAAPPPLVNAGFESVNADGTLAGWTSSGQGQQVAQDLNAPASGAASGHVAVEGAPGRSSAYGALSQTLPAQAFAGQVVRLRARVRTQSLGPRSRVVLWIRANSGEPEPLSFVDSRRSPITSSAWSDAMLVAPVASAAEKVTVGLMVTGPGEAWIDDVALAVVGVAQARREPPRPLTAQGRRNLIALAKLYADLRYFYPANAGDQADWDGLAIAGVSAVEGAGDAVAAAAALRRLFQPVAPDLQIWLTGTTSPAAPTLPARGVRWRHEGYGASGARPYRSERVATAAAADDLFATQLGNGVSVRFPLVVASASPQNRPALATVSGGPEDRTHRLADLVVLWAAVREFYPYFSDDGAAWDAAFSRALADAAEAPDAQTHRAVVERMIAALNDGHGSVTSPTEPRRGRIPVAWDWVAGQLLVTASTSQSGLIAGDVVVRLDGRDVAALARDEEPFVSAATPQWRQVQVLERLRIRPLGAVVKMEVLRAGRNLVLPVSVSALPPPVVARPESYTDLRPGVMYVDLTRTDNAALEAAMPRLAAARGVVFDLRGYPRINPGFLGHLADQPLKSAEWNVPILTRPGQERREWKDARWTLPARSPRITGKVVFLIDGHAISFAESVLSVVEGERLATLVGAPTAGTNGNVVPMTLPTGLNVTWTGMKVTRQDGSPHHGRGILPDLPVTRTVGGVQAGRDEALDAALALFDGSG